MRALEHRLQHDDAQGTQDAKPGLHVESPLLVVAIGELGEGGRGWRHGVGVVTWRATSWRNDEANGRKLRPGEREDGRGPRTSKCVKQRVQGRNGDQLRPESEGEGEFWTPEVFRAQGS